METLICAAVTGSASICEVLKTLGSKEHTVLTPVESSNGNCDSLSAFEF